MCLCVNPLHQFIYMSGEESHEDTNLEWVGAIIQGKHLEAGQGTIIGVIVSTVRPIQCAPPGLMVRLRLRNLRRLRDGE